jgi:pimeloyl-ACP methyl ester carboxylesterase
MNDAGLAERLAGVTTPTLVVWGDSDHIADADYGRAFAEAIPGARFKLLPDTGHLPQIETPGQLLDVVWAFAESKS